MSQGVPGGLQIFTGRRGDTYGGMLFNGLVTKNGETGFLEQTLILFVPEGFPVPVDAVIDLLGDVLLRGAFVRRHFDAGA